MKLLLFLLLLVFISVFCSEARFVPLEPCHEGRITYYKGWENGGACGFGAPKGKTGPGYNFGAAPNELFYNNASHCGECYELIGPDGALRVMITDMCPADDANPICHGDMIHFDLTSPSFSYLVANEKLGVSNITMRMVECDIEGPIKVFVSDDSSIWWMSLLAFNHRIGVKTIEYSEDSGSTFTQIRRENYNYWVFKPISNTFTFPMMLRITSIKNDIVYADIQQLNPGEIYFARSQFPSSDSSEDGEITSGTEFEECCSAPNHYSDVYIDGRLLGVWNDWSWSATIDLGSTDSCYSGTKCIKATLQSYGGLQIGSNFETPRNQSTGIEFYLKSVSSCSDCLKLDLGGSTQKTFGTTTLNTWEHFSFTFIDLGLGSADSPDISKVVFSNKLDSTIMFYVDDIKFIPNPSAPSLARCASFAIRSYLPSLIFTLFSLFFALSL